MPQIIKLSSEYSSRIAELETKCFAPFMQWNEKMIAESFNDGNTTFFGAQESDGLVGYIAVSYCCGEAELLKICVLPEFRRYGNAEKLFNAAFDNLVEIHGEEFEKMILEVAADNFSAKKLYEKCGFRELATRKGYYRDANKAIDAILMIKTVK